MLPSWPRGAFGSTWQREVLVRHKATKIRKGAFFLREFIALKLGLGVVEGVTVEDTEQHFEHLIIE